MGDPYAPKSVRRSNERVSELEQFLRRLASLGLDQEGLDDVRTNWNNFTDEWTPAYRTQLARVGDTELLNLIVERAQEWEASTVPQEAHDLDTHLKAVDQAESEAFPLMSDSVKSLVEWVGGVRARAMAVSNLERSPEGQSRPTLLAYVDGVLNGAA